MLGLINSSQQPCWDCSITLVSILQLRQLKPRELNYSPQGFQRKSPRQHHKPGSLAQSPAQPALPSDRLAKHPWTSQKFEFILRALGNPSTVLSKGMTAQRFTFYEDPTWLQWRNGGGGKRETGRPVMRDGGCPAVISKRGLNQARTSMD